MCIFVRSFHYPLVDVPGLAAEVHTYAVNFTAVLCEREGVLFILYLFKCILCAPVQLELHDIYIAVGLQHQVYPASRCMVFHFRVQPRQSEHYEKDVLVMQLDVLRQLVRAVRQERLQTFHEAVDVARFDVGYEVPDRESAPRLLQWSVIRKEELEEPFFHFPVREAQFIYARLRDIALDGQVTALVNHRYRIGRRRIDAVKDIGGRLLVRHPVQVVLMFLQQFDQIGRSPRLEPVAAVLSFLESVKQTERIVYAWAVRVEMIAVIVSLQPLTGLFEGLPVGPGKLLYVFAEVPVCLR